MNPDNEETARKFLEKMHYEIREDYKFKGVKYKDLCAVLAIIAGKKLLEEGRPPHLEQIIAPGTRTKRIVPLRFEGRVRWDLHVVCVCEGQAWDPILGEPRPIQTYAQDLLGEDLALTHFKPTDYIREMPDEKILMDFLTS